MRQKDALPVVVGSTVPTSHAVCSLSSALRACVAVASVPPVPGIDEDVAAESMACSDHTHR